jgi:hypothetical protein
LDILHNSFTSCRYFITQPEARLQPLIAAGLTDPMEVVVCGIITDVIRTFNSATNRLAH